MLLGESADDEEEDTPNSTKEDNAEDDDLPCVGVGGIPQDWRDALALESISNVDGRKMALTAPVTTIRRTEEKVLQNDGHKVPKDNLSA